MIMPYRGAHTPADLHPLSSIVLTRGDIATGKVLMQAHINPKVQNQYVEAQAWASCNCANSIIVDLMAKHRKHKMSGTRPTIVVVDEASIVNIAKSRADFVGYARVMTTTEYTELRLALVAAVDRGHLLFVRGLSTTSSRIRDQLDTWGGMAINGWFFKFLKHRRPQETITQFVERQTKPTTKE